MAFTSADLDTIRAAMATGVKAVTFADGRKTEYHSLDQMIAAERVIAAQVSMAEQQLAGRARTRFARYGSGL